MCALLFGPASTKLAAMRRVPAVLATLSLAATGCSFSSVDPESDIHISGRALDAAGKPLANSQVLLIKQADIGEVVFGTILAVGTLSAICFAPDPPTICDKARKTTTDADGRYAFDLKGADTQGSLGTEATMNVVFSGKSRTSTTVSFGAKETEIVLPDARLWNLAARVSQRSGEIDLTWSPLPRAAGSKPGYSAQVYGTGSGSLWSQPASGDRAELDPRLLEDKGGSVAVSAGATLGGGSGTGKVRVGYLSARLPVKASAGAPPSRGRRCAAVTGTAPQTAGFTKCAATDGDLDQPARLSAGNGAVVSGVVVDLGRARPIDLVVARGFAGQFLVEISDDGKTFSTVGTELGTAVAVRPQGSPTARFVRLRSPTGLDQSLSSELSVW